MSGNDVGLATARCAVNAMRGKDDAERRYRSALMRGSQVSGSQSGIGCRVMRVKTMGQRHSSTLRRGSRVAEAATGFAAAWNGGTAPLLDEIRG